MTYAPPYTPDKPKLSRSSDQLRASIPGWGADLDPADRPAVPRERFDPSLTGAHWQVPERQPEQWPRERSVEHTQLPPVFGTTCPPKGLSGAIRKHAYARYSEGQAAHWLLLIAGDRVDAWGSHLRSFASTRPDVPATGLRTELSSDGVGSRRGRSDVRHQVLDPVVVAGPWVAGAGLLAVGVRRVVRALRG
jgi:hypothetical protein